MFLTALVLAVLPVTGATRPEPAISAPITNVRYELTFDSTTAARKTVKVAMSFSVTGSAPVLLSLPSWSPGAYEVDNFARHVSHFEAATNGAPSTWDKLDYDTWRVRPSSAGAVTVRFDFEADTLDNAQAWSRPDFLMVNGTNVFLYPEGQGFDFASQVTVHTQSGWRVATGMHGTGAPMTWGERNYHDLVDMPLFIGRMDVDSQQISGKWTRVVTYPAGTYPDSARARLFHELGQIIPAHSRVFGVTPWDDYTVFIIFAPFGGISALEHQSSNVGVSDPQFIGTSILTNVIAHEIFHAWNVKRLRPAAMVPYRYDAAQPTTQLWVSEGFTDYFADLGEVRGGVIDSAGFLRNTMGHIGVVENSPPVSVEDASLSIWIHPTDGTDALYYDKGSVIGFLLDIQIRDASDNRASLDDVMRGLYQAKYLHGQGFTSDEFWAAVSRAAGGRSFQAFYERYVDGRDSLPYDSILPLAGLRIVTHTTRVPRMGVQTTTVDSVSRVVALVPGGAFQEAGVQLNDTLLSVGGIEQKLDVSADQFRARFAGHEGEAYPVVVRRAGHEITLTAHVKLGDNVVTRLEVEPNAPARAARVRAGILRGETGS